MHRTMHVTWSAMLMLFMLAILVFGIDARSFVHSSLTHSLALALTRAPRSTSYTFLRSSLFSTPWLYPMCAAWMLQAHSSFAAFILPYTIQEVNTHTHTPILNINNNGSGKLFSKLHIKMYGDLITWFICAHKATVGATEHFYANL